MSEEDTIICKVCKAEVSRFTGSDYYPGTWDHDKCALCNWIDTNNTLTEKERDELRERFKFRTHGS